ncbi:uncharacterized protein LOC127529233 [Erpetoichthys calabaricus]|uniref:uncharacterized protein LOC127529233 n=1 Tax=Erpetoichthys calabaricus TaxID=27687 RepID=UPI0022349CDE|nr:uncharacterized protein LOC127529233 [Erpetoichthys calabaricus]
MSCWPCPPGLYCGSAGLTHPSGQCAAGYFCKGGSKTARPEDSKCPKGYYCPLGSASPLLCPDGTSSNVTGLAECLDCPPGFYCLAGQNEQLCPQGHYCPGSTGQDVLPCPPGTFNSEFGCSQLEQCQLCPAGTSFYPSAG